MYLGTPSLLPLYILDCFKPEILRTTDDYISHNFAKYSK